MPAQSLRTVTLRGAVALMAGINLVAMSAAQPSQESQKATPKPAGRSLQVITLNARANALTSQGNYASALPLFEQALKIQQETYGDNHPDTAHTLNNMGLLYYRLGDHAQALPRLQSALKIFKLVVGDNDPDTANAMNNLGLLYFAQAEYAKARLLYEQAFEIFQTVLGDKEPRTARVLANLAELLRMQGHYTEALAKSRQALEMRTAVLGERHWETGNSLSNLAVLYTSLGDFSHALEVSQRGLDINLSSLGDKHLLTAISRVNVAAVHERRGDYAMALVGYHEALAMFRASVGDTHPQTLNAINGLATIYRQQGDYAKALPLLRQALEINKAVLGDEHPQTADNLAILADIYRMQGHVDRALPLYLEAVEAVAAAKGREHPDTALLLCNVAHGYDAQDNFAAAFPLHQQALQIFKATLGDQHPDTARCLTGIASHFADQRDFAQALPYLEQALAINTAVLGERHPATAGILQQLSRLYVAQGDYATALPLSQRSLEIQESVFGDKHPQTAQFLNNLAELHYEQGDYARAEQRFRQGADAFLGSRALVAQEGLQRAAFASTQSRLHEFCTVLVRNGKLGEAWQWLEKSLGRSIGDEIVTRQVLTESQRAQLQLLHGRIQQGRIRLEDLALRANLSPDQQTLQKKWLLEQGQLYAELGQLHQALRQEHGVLAGESSSLRDIQAALSWQTALVTWTDTRQQSWAVVVRREGDPIWVPIPEAEAAGGGDLAEQLGRGLKTVTRGARGTQELVAALKKQRLDPLKEHLDGITHLVVLPSERMDGIPVELLVEDLTVSYAPSGSIYAWLRQQAPVETQGLFALGDPVFERDATPPPELPTHGLLLTVVVPNSNAMGAGLRVGDVMLSYHGVALHHEADLDKALAASDAGQPARITYWRGGTEVESELKPGRMGLSLAREPAPIVLAQRRDHERLFVATRGTTWRELPGTRAEVMSLGQRFPKSGQAVRILTDSDASEQNVNRLLGDGALGTFRYLHFATHGEMNSVRPLQSSIILSMNQLPSTAEAAKMVQQGQVVPDGRLTAAEVLSDWNLRADMVTLSACESGLGKQERGEGYVGFSQALLLSGARSVVLSLWKVDDTATALLMDRFYENLLGQRADIQPMPKGQALAEAKDWLKTLSHEALLQRATTLTQGVARGKGRTDRPLLEPSPAAAGAEQPATPYADPYYWAAFILIGDPT